MISCHLNFRSNKVSIYVPPIKSQGIKTKLVPWINKLIALSNIEFDCWIEPFVGTCVVALNIQAKEYYLSDSNPHLIEFYLAVQSGKINTQKVREFLIKEGRILGDKGGDYYYNVRDRFNQRFDPLDFLFLNRACFNGMIRFNGHGKFNVPFCKKNERFTKSYITKICNQVKKIEEFFKCANIHLACTKFDKAMFPDEPNCILYCDPPYIDRYSDYFNNWTNENELQLFDMLKDYRSYFILSTWHHNKYRNNIYINKIWNRFNIYTCEHFYHLGGRETNRNSMTEALVTNICFTSVKKTILDEKPKNIQLTLPDVDI